MILKKSLILSNRSLRSGDSFANSSQTQFLHPIISYLKFRKILATRKIVGFFRLKIGLFSAYLSVVVVVLVVVVVDGQQKQSEPPELPRNSFSRIPDQ